MNTRDRFNINTFYESVILLGISDRIRINDYGLVGRRDVLSVEQDGTVAARQQRNIAIVGDDQHQMAVQSADLHSENHKTIF